MKAILGTVGMIVLAAVLVVAAAGGATYFAVRSAIAKPAAPVPQKTAKVQLKPLTEQEFLTNLSDPSGRRVIHIKVEVMVDDDKTVTALNAKSAAIRDQILRILHGTTVQDLANEDGLDNLKQQIVNRLNATVAEGKIKDLYFTDYAVQ